MKRVLFVICLASSLAPFMGSSLNLALPYISRSLSLDVGRKVFIGGVFSF